jgi:hypothetical protein
MRLVICCLLILSMVFIYDAYAKIDKSKVVGMWLFEDGVGDVVRDVSGNGNDGKPAGKLKSVNGKFGKALEFNGTDTWIEVPFNDSLVLEECTIVAWGKIANVNKYQSILMRGQDPRNYLLCTNINGGALLVSITKGAKGAWAGPASKTSVTDDEWHHLAAVIGQKTGLVVYVDGVNEGMQAYGKPSLDADPANIRIGDGSAGGHLLQGVLDEVALFKVPLEQADIQDIMNNGLEIVTGLKASVGPKDKITNTWGNIKNK